MRLIDADEIATIENLSQYRELELSLGTIQTVRDILNDAATIEAEPVRHGKWIGKRKTGLYDDWYCSNCNTFADVCNKKRLGKFCPNCGAKMDGDKE